jgi:hypothetical protein
MKTAVELINNSQNASVETKLLLLALKVDELTEELKTARLPIRHFRQRYDQRIEAMRSKGEIS